MVSQRKQSEVRKAQIQCMGEEPRRGATERVPLRAGYSVKGQKTQLHSQVPGCG